MSKAFMDSDQSPPVGDRTTTTVKTTKAAPVEIEAPRRQVLNLNLRFWL